MSVRFHTWNGNVVSLTKFSPLAAPKVVKMATFGAASGENFVKMTSFPFQCMRGLHTRYQEWFSGLFINPRWHAELVLKSIGPNIYLQFLSFLTNKMAQVVKILPHGPSQSRPYKSYTVNTIAADDLATPGARPAAAMVLVQFSHNIPVSTEEESTYQTLTHKENVQSYRIM